MPTYDAERTAGLIAELDDVYRSPATKVSMSLGRALADQLLAATQEIERLNVLARCDHELNECSQLTIKRLTGEIEKLRTATTHLLWRSVADCNDCTCDAGVPHVDLCPECIAMKALGFERGWTGPEDASDLLAAIRHAAGLEEG